MFNIYAVVYMIVGFTYNSKKDVKPDLPEDTYIEFDDVTTINAIRDAIKSTGHTVLMLEADENIFDKIKSSNADIIFNIAEGISGESRESQVPIICEMFGIPYTGSGPLTLALTLDKAKTKEILLFNGIPTPRFQVFNSEREKLESTLMFPLIVKPVREGSSKGVMDNCVVKNKKELVERVGETLTKYSQPVLVEQYLPGREFTIAVLGNDDPRVLPIVEIVFDDLPSKVNKIDSYEAKWVWDDPKNPLDCLICPAKTNKKLENSIKKISSKAYKALGCRDWARIDIRLDSSGTPNILEINALPGVIPHPKNNSRFPRAAAAAGMDYDEMILTVLNTALQRHNLREDEDRVVVPKTIVG